MGDTFTEHEIELLAKSIAEKIPTTHTCHLFTEEEVDSIKSILHTKKKAAKLMLIVFGTLMLWALKDIYDWSVEILRHLHIVSR